MATERLTNEQVKVIVDRLDEVVGNEFHDAICVALNEFGWGKFGDDEGIDDSDVYRIKSELALGYLNEYKQYYDNKHESNS